MTSQCRQQVTSEPTRQPMTEGDSRAPGSALKCTFTSSRTASVEDAAKYYEKAVGRQQC